MSTHPMTRVGDLPPFSGPFPPDPCPYCGVSLSWLREGETVKGTGNDRAHSGCYDMGGPR